MFIVSCHRAMRMSGTRGALVKNLVAAESMLEFRAPMCGILSIVF